MDDKEKEKLKELQKDHSDKFNELDHEKFLRRKSNSGYCYLVLKNTKEANLLLEDNLKTYISSLDQKEYQIRLANIKAEEPFLMDDIMWENLDSNQTVAVIKQWVFCVFLFIFFLFLMVPTNVFNLMNRGDNKLWRGFVSFL